MSYEFLNLPDEDAYRAHFLTEYCKGPLSSIHGFPVYFSPDDFDHAFFESTKRDGVKDLFSAARSSRMDWISESLLDPHSHWHQGWDNKKRRYDTRRPVCVSAGDFVVVVRLSYKRDGSPKGNFVTCYWADNSIGKIRSSPLWVP